MALAPRFAMFQIWVVALMAMSGATNSVAAPHPTPSSTVASNGNTTINADTANHQVIQQQVKHNTARLQQLEQANQDALARNQELQLMNDNLTVQVQVLQSERSAQMFLYGAATLAVGAFIGFLLANFILSKRTRRW